MSPTAFETRRRRIKFPRRDQVRYNEASCPELAALLHDLEDSFIKAVSERDSRAADFIEWYADEALKYGVPVRSGLVALYWQWSHPNGEMIDLDWPTFEAARDHLAAGLANRWLDGMHHTGRTIVQELIWWSCGEWLLQDHLIVAMREFHEFWAEPGKMKHWRKKKHRRLAAARRKALKADAAVAAAKLRAENEPKPKAA